MDVERAADRREERREEMRSYREEEGMSADGRR